MGTVFFSSNCVLDSSVGSNSFLNYLHQQEIKTRRLRKFSPKPNPKSSNVQVFSFESHKIRKPTPHHHKSQTLNLSSLYENLSFIKENSLEIASKLEKPKENHMNSLLNLKNLSIEKKLGNSHSNVMLVRDNKNQLFIMKIIQIEARDFILEYSEALKKMKTNTFVTEILNIFIQENSFYIITEYMSKGEMNKSLTHYFSEQIGKFYLAELLLGLMHIHSQMKGYYKLLSFENIFLDNKNHLKISNFGSFTPFNPFSISNAVSPFCRTGSCANTKSNENEEEEFETPMVPGPKNNRASKEKFHLGEDFNMEKIGYYPPEIFMGKDIDEKSDSWVIGAWLYEILTGRNLVKIENRADFQEYLKEEPEMIINGEKLSEECRDLLKKLMKKKSGERLGLEEIKRHEFLKGIEWEKMIKKEGVGPMNMGKKGHHRSELVGRM